MIWNREKETMSDSKKEAIQSELLKNLVKRVYKTIPFYRNKIDSAGINPEGILLISDIEKLPFTTKD
ncbi:MAG: phenylacetate--CoA ligase, partial [Spirochaetes bacterium]|nr:phenylacetate--CoA ligase [Spirochaetota bacterium]